MCVRRRTKNVVNFSPPAHYVLNAPKYSAVATSIYKMPMKVKYWFMYITPAESA